MWQFSDESFEALTECFPQCLHPFTFLPVMYNNSNFYILRICLLVVAAIPTGVLCLTVALMHVSLNSPRVLNTFSTH